MKINVCLLFMSAVVLSACSPKAAENKEDKVSIDTFAIEYPADNLSADTVFEEDTSETPASKLLFTPPVIVGCEDPDPGCLPHIQPVEKGEPDSTIVKRQEPYWTVEVMPSFPGGDSALWDFIAANLKYPVIEADVQGRVVLRFVVDKEGDIKDVKILRSIHPDFDKEAVRVVNSMPKWNVGSQNGIPVDVYFTLPIVFKTSY